MTIGNKKREKTRVCLSAPHSVYQAITFAQLLDISPKYLSAIVADGTGMTSKEFIDRAAVKAIKDLLSQTSLSVTQIADRLHFSGKGNLCRFFKTNTGITISDFKRSPKPTK